MCTNMFSIDFTQLILKFFIRGYVLMFPPRQTVNVSYWLWLSGVISKLTQLVSGVNRLRSLLMTTSLLIITWFDFWIMLLFYLYARPLNTGRLKFSLAFVFVVLTSHGLLNYLFIYSGKPTRFKYLMRQNTYKLNCWSVSYLVVLLIQFRDNEVCPCYCIPCSDQKTSLAILEEFLEHSRPCHVGDGTVWPPWRPGPRGYLVMLVMAFCCMVFDIYRTVSVNNTMEKLLKNPEEFADFSFLSYWQIVFNSSLAVLVFFAWVKVWKWSDGSESL